MSNSVSRRRSGVGRVARPGMLFKRRDRNSPAITRISPPSPNRSGAANDPECRERCLAAPDLENLALPQDIGNPQRRKARLLGPEELAGTAQLQVHFGNIEAVGR